MEVSTDIMTSWHSVVYPYMDDVLCAHTFFMLSMVFLKTINIICCPFLVI